MRVERTGGLGLTVSNPPTQADVQAIADKLDELINSLQSVLASPAARLYRV